MMLKGDCIEVMKAMKPNSVDAIVTDPPYGLRFMNKDWDTFSPDFVKNEQIMATKEFQKAIARRNDNPNLTGRKNSSIHSPAAIAGSYDFSPTGNKAYQEQMKQWLTEAYRVLKPGGSMLVMGGTRTSHRLACAIEDSGFIIKDTLMYLYGSGFPKAQDLTKMLEKRNAKKATEQDTKYNLRSMQKTNLSQTISTKETEEKTMQSGLSKQGISEYRKEGSESEVANGEQPSVEGRGNLFQEEGKLQERGLYKSSTMGKADGKERRIHNGASVNDGSEAKQIIDKRRGDSSHRPQSSKQPTKESNVIREQSGTQDLGRWEGFKVGGIKPAYEPIIWAVKPPEGSYVDNVLKWGVGAVNVDECRISTNEDLSINGNRKNVKSYWQLNPSVEDVKSSPKGRFPANIILSHHPECVQVGMKKVKGSNKPGPKGFVNDGMFNIKRKEGEVKEKYGGPETVESWDCHPDCAVRLLDEQSGVLQSKWGKDAPDKMSGNINYVGKKRVSQQQFRGDSGGASRFFKQCNYGQEEWLCHEGCALRQLDEQSGDLKSGANPERRNSAKTKTCYGEFEGQKECISYRGQNSGGASRFFYCAKASRSERNAGLEGMEEKSVSDRHGGWGNELTWIDRKDGKGKVPVNAKMTPASNNHPTVKPIKLFEYLIKLVTREGQIVLDPFIGSGTTGIAAHNTGRKCMGIEKEDEYIEIAKRRMAYGRSRPRQLEM